MTLEQITREFIKSSKQERQFFDFKSIRISPNDIVIPVSAFANAEGGFVIVGVEDKTREITGVDGFEKQENALRAAVRDFIKPAVPHEAHLLDIIDDKGNPNHLLVFEVKQGKTMFTTNKDEVYVRVGDKSKKLNFEERMSFMYSKGARYFDYEPVYNTSINDIDFDLVKDYCDRIGYSKTPREFILENRFIASEKGELSSAAVLLFSKNVAFSFPRARIRVIKYEGTEALTGAEMNVIKDRIFKGRILEQLNGAIDFVRDQLKEHTYLGKDGLFVTEPEYPEFVWKELIVNAVCHRDYYIKGTDIQVKIFDDHYTVESPGSLPGDVTKNNIRHTHFSRNPVIAEYLHAYEFVKEFGEGVDRMCKEMETVGLEDPVYDNETFILSVSVYNKRKDVIEAHEPENEPENEPEKTVEEKIIGLIKNNPKISKDDMAKEIGVSRATVTRALKASKRIKRIGPDKGGHWEIIE